MRVAMVVAVLLEAKEEEEAERTMAVTVIIKQEAAMWSMSRLSRHWEL